MIDHIDNKNLLVMECIVNNRLRYIFNFLKNAIIHFIIMSYVLPMKIIYLKLYLRCAFFF